MTTPSEFTAVLRDQIATTQRALLAAQEASQPRQVYRHSVRLLDLLDRAARNGVDTTGCPTTRGHRERLLQHQHVIVPTCPAAHHGVEKAAAMVHETRPTPSGMARIAYGAERGHRHHRPPGPQSLLPDVISPGIYTDGSVPGIHAGRHGPSTGWSLPPGPRQPS